MTLLRRNQTDSRAVEPSAIAAVALLCLAGQLGASAHFFLVSHRECSVHGLEEAGGHEAAGLDREASPGLPALTGIPESGGASDDGHEQCLLALVRRSLHPGPAFGSASFASPATRSLPATVLAGRQQGPALLRLAPKASPPV